MNFPPAQPDHKGILRLVPHFFIIGERKCGTSSLFRYLVDHPSVLSGVRKEPNVFGNCTELTQEEFKEYLSQFPLANSTDSQALLWPELDAEGNLYEEPVAQPRQEGVTYITGEASANTFHEANPELVHQFLPNARFVLIFRNPVERAFSHHRMFLRFQKEERELGRKILSFEEEMSEELANNGAGEFLAPGKYIDNLRKWDAVFPQAQRLVLFANELDAHPQQVMDRVLAHLGLPAWTYPERSLTTRYNQAPPSEMPDRILSQLQEFFEPYDQALSAYLDNPIPWRQ